MSKSVRSEISLGDKHARVTVFVNGGRFVFDTANTEWENPRQYERAECACSDNKQLKEVNELWALFLEKSAKIYRGRLI